MISVSKRIYNVQYCCGTWERNDSNPGSDILPSHMRLRPSQLWVWICVPLPQMNLQGHEMEMPRPLMVITLKIHFTFLIYFKMWNRIEACPTTPLSWHLDTDRNPSCAGLKQQRKMVFSLILLLLLTYLFNLINLSHSEWDNYLFQHKKTYFRSCLLSVTVLYNTV